MKKIIILLVIILFSIVFVSCGKDDSHLSNEIFDEYNSELEKAGYSLNQIDATNNMSGWLEITDKDVVSVYRASSDNNNGILYLYLFPTERSAGKWYDKISEQTMATNYITYLDGHYVIVALGSDVLEIAEKISS